MAETLLYVAASFSKSCVRSNCALCTLQVFASRAERLSIVFGPWGCRESDNEQGVIFVDGCV